jgi:Rieske Fe-S protein
MSNGIHSVDGLLVKKLKAPSKTVSQIKNGEGAIVRKKGKAVAAYRDDEGKVHTVCPNCSHMGCRLSFNSELKSWDCPCHGSRFDVDGKVLDNPALKDLEKY